MEYFPHTPEFTYLQRSTAPDSDRGDINRNVFNAVYAHIIRKGETLEETSNRLMQYFDDFLTLHNIDKDDDVITDSVHPKCFRGYYPWCYICWDMHQNVLLDARHYRRRISCCLSKKRGGGG